MECSKCGCTKIKIDFDSRGLAEARCADCGALIKKLKVQEVADFYKDQIADLTGAEVTEDDRKPCRYCTENYAIVLGSIRSARQYVPVEAKFCPMCGRKLKETDRSY